MDEPAFDSLVEYLSRIPCVVGAIGHGVDDGGMWWVKFEIDIHHELAWHAVQELGHVLNYLSIEERLPTNFYPVSPPPYMNGGPEDYLSWVIENREPSFGPNVVREWLEGRLPQPVDSREAWGSN